MLGAVPRFEHDETVSDYQKQIADLNGRLAELLSIEAEVRELRDRIAAVQPQLDQFAGERASLEQSLAVEQEKRRAAEELVENSDVVRSFEEGVARALRGYAERKNGRPRAKASERTAA